MSYRASYIDKTNGSIYLCAYCCKPMKKDTMTVDHLIPQNLFRKFQKLMITICLLAATVAGAGIYLELLETSVLLYLLPLFVLSFCLVFIANKYKDSRANLVAACQSCNSSKSDKIDLRIVRGFVVNVVFSKLGVVAILGCVAYLLFTGQIETTVRTVTGASDTIQSLFSKLTLR